MLIDAIVERRMGVPYSSVEFFCYLWQWENGWYSDVLAAMCSGKERDVKRSLCAYILDGGYNEELCDYINSVDWLDRSEPIVRTYYRLPVDCYGQPDGDVEEVVLNVAQFRERIYPYLFENKIDALWRAQC